MKFYDPQKNTVKTLFGGNFRSNIVAQNYQHQDARNRGVVVFFLHDSLRKYPCIEKMYNDNILFFWIMNNRQTTNLV